MKKSIPPSQLLLLGISGFRSYDFKGIQKIKLEGNLTLIWGLNGSGKSTILQLLKFLLTGVTPPNTDKGKTFLLNPKVSKTHKVISDGRIKFRSASGRQYIIVRKFQLNRKANNTLQIKSLVQELRFIKDNQQFALNKRVADLPLLAEQLLQISNATLKYISFCHQQQSYWPFSDNNTLRDIFDQILETHKLHQCLESLQKCLTNRKKQQKDLQKQVQYAQSQLKRATKDNQQTLQNVIQMQDYGKKLAVVKKQYQKQKEWNLQKQNLRKQEKQLLIQQTQLNTKLNNSNREILIHKANPKVGIINLSNANEILQKLESEKAGLIQKQKRNQSIYQQLKKSEQKSQLLSEIQSEVRRVKQYFPQFKKIQFQKQLLESLSKKCNYLQDLKQEKIKLQKKIPQLAKVINKDIYNIKSNIQELEKHIKHEQQKMKIVHLQVSAFYRFLFKQTIDMDKQKVNFQAEIQLNKLKWKMQEKRQQIENCKGIQVPKKPVNIDNMKFAGIEMQQQMICYCKKYKKCMFCHKSMEPKQIEDFIKNRQKTISTYQAQIQKLEKQQMELGQPGQDPQKIIRRNQHFLQRSAQIQSKLIKQVENANLYKQNQETKQTNRKLQYQLKKIEKQIQSQFKVIASAGPEKCTLREYQQACSNYIDQSRKIKSLAKSLREQTQDLKVNQSYIIQNQKKQKEIEYIKQRIQKLNDQLSLYHSTKCSYQKLQQLFLSRDRAKSLDNKDKADNNISQIQENLIKTKKEIEDNVSAINNMKQSIVYTNQVSVLQKLKQQKNVCDDRLGKVISNIKQLQRKINELGSVRQKYGSFTAQYNMRQKKIRGFCQHTKYYELYFKIQLIKKQIFELSIKCKAFQKSISLVHQEQLKKINTQIAKIWKIIYHDDDIDTIEIRVTPDESNTQKKKSYHYRILMLKGQLQRVMNGACSSGQKVLACLVIRIALCKTLNKGQSMVIALDQPTAHLDSMHTERLAEQIKTLIKMFHNRIQFLIISHDANFVKRLTPQATNYYHVSRDEEGYSHVNQATGEDLVDSFQRREVVIQIGE